VDNEILQALQLFGVDSNVTTKELQMKWRILSSHTHPDRFKRGTPEFDEALAKQTRLNCARDRVKAFIDSRDAQRTLCEELHRKEQQQNNTWQEEPVEQTCSFEMPHIRTSEHEQDETILNLNKSLIDEISSVIIFFGALFFGITAALFVSAALPTVAITAPVILIVVMLVTMFAALTKLKKCCALLDERIGARADAE
jgi:hypothetical protein